MLCDDVKYRKIRVDSPSGTVSVHMILIDQDAIREGRLAVEAATGTMGQTASVQSIARRESAVACLNGPYFASAGSRIYPLGFTVLNGQITQIGNYHRAMAGIDRAGEFRIEVAHPKVFVTSEAWFEPIWIWGINTSAGENAVTYYDRNWGTRVNPQGGIAVSIASMENDNPDEVIEITNSSDYNEDWDGEVVEISDSGSIGIPEGGYVLVFRGRSMPDADRYQAGTQAAIFIYNLPDGWESMRWISTLGPWFVHEGHYRNFTDETSFGGGILGSAVRSVIGTTWNDDVFFATTTGPGLNIRETAEVLIECNVREAVMCDSGSSSGMWIRGIGNVGSSRAIPLAFIVREPDEPLESPATELRIWEGRLLRN